MIRDLDDTLQELLKQQAPPHSELEEADIDFEIPDAEWRSNLGKLTVNCYLYDIRENRGLRTHEPLVQREGNRAVHRQAPVRIDCAYCITAWSPATAESAREEHRLLSQVLTVLIKHPSLPKAVLRGKLAEQIPPYPTVIAAPDGVKNPPEFWGALDQQLKPSLNYVVTLAVLLDEAPAEMPLEVQQVVVETHHLLESR